MNSSKTIGLLLLFVTFVGFSESEALFGPPLYKSLYQFEDADRQQPYLDDGKMDSFWAPPSSHEPALFNTSPYKRNFYTHFWRNIVQRMPNYRAGNNRISSLVESPVQVDVDKRTPWIERMNAIRTG
ncbi:hypothetical protein GPALN_010411 [Globodera pallida]|nr:hypothetical protein GPALN_010411 [Globodera pallida]